MLSNTPAPLPRAQDRLETAQIYVSATDPVVNGRFNPQGAQSCGALSDHTNVPEVSTCNNVQGQYVTIAHSGSAAASQTGPGGLGGTSGGRVVTICEIEIWGSAGGGNASGPGRKDA